MPGVDAVHIRRRIGFGITQRLGLLQSFVIAQTQTGHGVQDVVTGAVHNATHLLDLLHPAGTLQFGQPADTAAHGSSAAELHTLGFCQRDQLVVKGANQSLVGSHYILAGFDGGTDKLIGRMQTAHGLHNGIDGVVRQHGLKILGHFCIGKRNVFQADNFRNIYIISCGGNVIKTSSDHAETQ